MQYVHLSLMHFNDNAVLFFIGIGNMFNDNDVLFFIGTGNIDSFIIRVYIIIKRIWQQYTKYSMNLLCRIIWQSSFDIQLIMAKISKAVVVMMDVILIVFVSVDCVSGQLLFNIHTNY